MSNKDKFMKTGLPECDSLSLETRNLIHSNIVYEKRNREEIIEHFNLTTKAEINFLDESLKITTKLMRKWGLFEPQEVASGF